MKNHLLKLAAAWLALAVPGGLAQSAPERLPAAVAQQLSVLDVAWDAPGGEMASMPIGNGDITSNVWVEENGDLVFYLGKSDAWDEINCLLKVGKVRVSFTPALPVKAFSQRLDLRRGEIVITAGEGNDQVTVRAWVDANQPVLRVEQSGGMPRTCAAKVELWRTEDKPIENAQHTHTEDSIAQSGATFKRLADTVLPPNERQILWCHRNTASLYPVLLKAQHLEALAAKHPDPLLNRTFGAIGFGTGMKATAPLALASTAPASQRTLSFVVLTAQTPTIEEWTVQAKALAASVEKRPAAETRAAHQAWWEQFWNRSWLFVDGHDAMVIPANVHAWKVGAAADGTYRLAGEISDPLVIGRAMTEAEIAILAATPRIGKTVNPETIPTTAGCTVAAWINPKPGEQGRILDNGTPGQPDGLTFDTYPGLSLRWIVGQETMIAANVLKPGQWQHVAATVDAASGSRRLYLDGKLIKEQRGEASAETVTRGYNLQRYLIGASSRGPYPPKFNGGAFTVNMGGKCPFAADSPDYRSWGGSCYWFQNNRFLCWPSLASGDYDTMMPFFNMYRHMLEFRRDVTKTYYGHEGAFFVETFHFWGSHSGQDFGWKNPGNTPQNIYVRWYWQGGLELSMMMLDTYAHTGDTTFAKETLLPIADAVVTFYDQHWQRDGKGKIRFDPTASLETFDGINDAPTIAGLNAILPRLLALPAEFTTAAQRAAWKKTLADLPLLPMATAKDKTVLTPADKYWGTRNMENPELYAIFPYRLYGLGLPELQIAKDSFAARHHRHQYCWSQDCIQAAELGLAEEAKSRTVGKFSAPSAPQKFPAFWNPNWNFDWTTDMDHGGSAALALSEMLMQCPGDKILLLPAWPKEWKADFKLHAPRQTIVEGHVENGQIKNLKVTPETRRQDVEIIQAPAAPGNPA
jgi:hypothetical protein